MNIVSKEKHANINGTSFSRRVQENRGKKRILKRVLYIPIKSPLWSYCKNQS